MRDLLLDWVLKGKKTRAVRQVVVRSSRTWVAALVEELEVARVHSHGLIIGGADQVTVGNIVGPGCTGVGLASERVSLSRSLWSPGTAQAGGGEGAEEAAVGTLGFNNHEIFVLSSQRVDLHRLEELRGRRAHHDGGGGTETAWEVADGHAGAVDGAVVAGEEEVHVLAVADDGLVDGARAGAGDGA